MGNRPGQRKAKRMAMVEPHAAVKVALREAEGSGRVEFKRSAIWPSEEHRDKVQQVLMRLANGNPESGGYIELGREDDGTCVGLVDKDKQPVVPRQLTQAEQTLVNHAREMTPAMAVRWHRLSWEDGMETIAIEVPGRLRGSWYQGKNGATYTNSAGHPLLADPAILKRWALEDHRAIDEQDRHEAVRPTLRMAMNWFRENGQERGSITVENWGRQPALDLSVWFEKLPPNISHRVDCWVGQFLTTNIVPHLALLNATPEQRAVVFTTALLPRLSEGDGTWRLQCRYHDILDWTWQSEAIVRVGVWSGTAEAQYIRDNVTFWTPLMMSEPERYVAPVLLLPDDH